MKPYFKDFTCPAYTDKLKADNINIICERNGVKKPLYVGDTKMDADTFIYQEVTRAAEAAGVPCIRVASMKELGILCGVDVSTAAAGILR